MSPETAEYALALRAILKELDEAGGTLEGVVAVNGARMRIRNAKRIARIALGDESCSLCDQDQAKAEGRAFKTVIVFHTCGRVNP
jgi:hypothetical protein